MEGSGAPRTSYRRRSVKRMRWGGLRQQWKLLGLFEIDQNHEFYSLTCMMKEGLFAAIQNTISLPTVVLFHTETPTPYSALHLMEQCGSAYLSKNELSDDDFRSEVTQIHKAFRMQTFAGTVFASLREYLGMTEEEYQQSLCSESCFLQFISNSKSKADFFLTNDKRFFLKTQSKREIQFLLKHLKTYVEHLRRFPHSLLVKFLGVHRIQIPQGQKKYFIVMQSVFYPDERIQARFDIKGCEVSRWTEPAPEGSQVIVVLKDLNFEGQFITLEHQRAWLLQQLDIDTDLLRRLNVLDYSLLLAQQPLHQDERHQSLSFASLIVRTKKSVNPGSSPILTCVPGVVPDSDTTLPSPEPDSGFKLTHRTTSSFPPGLAGPGTDEAGQADFKAQNRRLLPNLKNPLHVIDGPEQRYFIGIIDIFTVYNFRKKLEHLWKSLRHPGRSFSTVSPQAYCTRLCQWVQNHSK